MKKVMKKGVSIAEMCIVLAVLAIASIAVITFTTLVSARSSTGVVKLNAMEDLQVSQIILENWVETMRDEGATISVDDETGVMFAEKDGETYTVTLEEERLVAPLPGGEGLYCPIGTVEQFHFSQMTQGDSALYFCTVTYSVPNPAGEDQIKTETFTIFSRVGDEMVIVTPTPEPTPTPDPDENQDENQGDPDPEPTPTPTPEEA